MKLAQLFILLFAFLLIKPASAGLLVEPVVGFSGASFAPDLAVMKDGKGSGLSYGGRLGYQNFGFQLGLDYLNSNINISESRYSNANVSEFAGFVGFEFPVFLRVYAGYIFSATGSSKYDAGAGKQDLDLKEGTGMKAGLGLTALPFVDINFEYRKGTFGEGKLGGAKFTDDTSYDAYMISLSLPFVL